MVAGLGIDVGAERLHCVLLSGDGAVLETAVLRADDLAGVRVLAERAGAVAIDAPQAPSTAPHAGDASISPKFRTARCAEIGLGRLRRIWVPWPTPATSPYPAWMLVGFRLFEALEDRSNVVETYPHAVFRTLAGGSIPPKRSAEGRARRVELLLTARVRASDVATWGHDSLDAAAAALVVIGVADGSSVAVTCGHDGSAIWLPGAMVATPA